MTATLLTFPVFRAFDSNGAPLAGGLLYSYQAGAGNTTPLATYVDQAGVTQNTNPVVLDSTGTANVWLGDNTYKLVLKDSEGVQQWSVDNIQSEGSQISTAVSAVYSDFANTSNVAKGDALVGVKQPFTDASARTQHQKNSDSVSVLDFGADNTGTTDCTSAILAAIASKKMVLFPVGDYKCNLNITQDGAHLVGELQGQYASSGAVRLIPADSATPVVKFTGPIADVCMDGFLLDSKSDSTYSHAGVGLQLSAANPNFIWRGSFKHIFIRGFEDGLVIDCDVNLSEVFDCDFQDIEAIGCSRYSFKTRGVYNRFGKLFATQCGISGGSQPTSDYGLYHDGSNCFFDIVTTDGRQYWAGTGNLVGNAIIEAIYGPGAGASYPAMELSGTGWNTWQKIRLNGVPTTKYPYGVRMAGTNQFIGDIVIEGANYPATGLLFAGGSSGILGAATQPGTNASRPVDWNFLGDVSGAINGGGPNPFPWSLEDAWDGTRFVIADGIWNVVLNPNASPLTAGTIVMPQDNPPVDGQVVSISTTKTITTMHFTTEGSYYFYDGSQSISGAFSAGSSKSFIFRLSNNTWYPI